MERESTQDIYRRLIEQGTPQEEIDQVYRKLRQAGYGEEAARQRLEASLRRLREQQEVARRRRDAIGSRTSPSRGSVSGGWISSLSSVRQRPTVRSAGEASHLDATPLLFGFGLCETHPGIDYPLARILHPTEWRNYAAEHITN